VIFDQDNAVNAGSAGTKALWTGKRFGSSNRLPVSRFHRPCLEQASTVRCHPANRFKQLSAERGREPFRLCPGP